MVKVSVVNPISPRSSQRQSKTNSNYYFCAYHEHIDANVTCRAFKVSLHVWKKFKVMMPNKLLVTQIVYFIYGVILYVRAPDLLLFTCYCLLRNEADCRMSCFCKDLHTSSNPMKDRLLSCFPASTSQKHCIVLRLTALIGTPWLPYHPCMSSSVVSEVRKYLDLCNPHLKSKRYY